MSLRRDLQVAREQLVNSNEGPDRIGVTAEALETVGSGSRREVVYRRMGTGGEWARLQLARSSSHRLGRQCVSSLDFWDH